MSVDEVLVARDDAMLRVIVNRPHKHNALSRAVLGRLRSIFEANAGDDRIRVAVLTGAGDRSFAAGGNLRELASVRTRHEAEVMADQAKAALDAVREFPAPVVAALNGNAMGGGAELALACDFRVASASARIGFVQGRLNISTAWGGGIDLMRLLGPSRALEVLCRAEMLDPAEALGLGLVDAVSTSDDGLESTVQEFTRPFLSQAPQVLRAFKALARGAREGAARARLYQLETKNFATTWIHEDHWVAAERVLAKSVAEERR